ncbi:hypothetical protein PG999_010476 [Apiospora kogelbergensis]|uniref:Uncharacterized protein n=1 Tax=Apiospora kogelbergensis TaxID=1337665 RepID=A0AAW0QCD9_9PEZI
MSGRARSGRVEKRSGAATAGKGKRPSRAVARSARPRHDPESSDFESDSSDSDPSDSDASDSQQELEPEPNAGHDGESDFPDSGEDGDEDKINDPPRSSKKRPEPKSLTAKRKAEERENVLLEHFRLLPEDVKSAVILSTKHLAHQSQRAKKRLAAEKPVPGGDEALSYIPGRPERWSNREEAQIAQQWANSAEHRALDAKPTPTPHMKALWKTWLRLFHVAPSCFVSVYNCLQYHDKLADGVTPNPNWSHDFCKRLRSLSLHGIFQGRVELLHLALLWVPICRQDYRGSIQWENPSPDRLLTDLMKAMADQDGSLTIGMVHDRVRSEYQTPGFMSDLLKGIEKRAFKLKASGQPVFRPQTVEPFDVSANDLLVVRRAANAVKGLGFPAFYPMAMSQRVVAAAQSSHGYPKDNADLLRLRKEAALSVLRFDVRRKVLIAEGPNRDPSPADLGNDHMDVDDPEPGPTVSDPSSDFRLPDNPVDDEMPLADEPSHRPESPPVPDAGFGLERPDGEPMDDAEPGVPLSFLHLSNIQALKAALASGCCVTIQVTWKTICPTRLMSHSTRATSFWTIPSLLPYRRSRWSQPVLRCPAYHSNELGSRGSPCQLAVQPATNRLPAQSLLWTALSCIPETATVAGCAQKTVQAGIRML